MDNKTRIVFMGSDPIALPLLCYLRDQAAEQVELVGIFTQPDRPSGRGMKVIPNAIKQWAQAENLVARQPLKCGPEDEQWLQDCKVDLILVMAFGQLLRKSLIAIPPRGVVNFHASILPQLRGASPIHTAIAIGEKETGVSLMQIVPKLDAGPVCDVERVAIPETAQAPEIIETLSAACVPLLARNLERLCRGEADFFPQDEAAATYCRRITREDAHLDFHRPAQELHDHIRAFQPWPGALLKVDGQSLKIGKTTHSSTPHTLAPGTLRVEFNRVFVACGSGEIELLSLQRPGGKMLPVADFLKGFPLTSGSLASSEAMYPLVKEKPFSRP